MPKKKDSIPLYPVIDPQASTGLFANGGGFSRNAMLEVYSNGSYYVTQRPGIDVVAEPEQWDPVDPKGRGIYYWEQEDILIVVVDDTVFTGGGVQIGTISPGKDTVWISAFGNFLVILDEENNQGWALNSGLVLAQITDPDFPTTLAGGGAVLNNLLYVLDEDGIIYNSDQGDPFSWNALDFTDAEREPDGGVYITKFLEHIVVFGTRTMEFFYDAGNPTGSPLNRRDDISYRIGATDAKSIYNSGDVIYFISADVSGSLKLQALQGFQLVVLSTPQLDRYMEARQRSSEVDILLSGSHVFGHLFVYMTFVIEQEGFWLVQETLCYDAASKHFSEFNSRYPGIDFFPVAAWADRQGNSIDFSFGILTSGQIVRWSGSVIPVDRAQADPYFAPGYVTPGYVSNLTGAPEEVLYIDNDFIEDGYWDSVDDDTSMAPTIEMIVRTELWDGSVLGPYSEHNKFIHKVELVGARLAEFVPDDEPINLRWSDDNYDTFSPFRPVQIGSKQRLTMCGMTQRRAFDVSYRGINRVRWEKIDITFGVSSYA